MEANFYDIAMKLGALGGPPQASGGLEDEGEGVVIGGQAILPEAMEKGKHFCEATLLGKGLDDDVVADEVWRLVLGGVVEDPLGVGQGSKMWVGAEEKRFVEGVLVMVEMGPEELCLDLLESEHRFAGSKVKEKTCLLACCRWCWCWCRCR